MDIAFFLGATGIFLGATGIGALAFVLHRSLARSKSAIAGIVVLSIAAVAWLLLDMGNIDPEGADTTTHGVTGFGLFLRLSTRLAAPLVLAAAFRREERWDGPPATHPRAWNRSFGVRGRRLSDLASVVTLRLSLGLWLV